MPQNHKKRKVKQETGETEMRERGGRKGQAGNLGTVVADAMVASQQQ